jgi:hypothetical protein
VSILHVRGKRDAWNFAYRLSLSRKHVGPYSVVALARDGNLRQDVHPPDFCGYPEVFARALLHPHYAGVAANPALLPGCEFGGKNQDQFHIRPLNHAGCTIEKYAMGADIASFNAQLAVSSRALNAHRKTSNNPSAGAAIDVRSHDWKKSQLGILH